MNINKPSDVFMVLPFVRRKVQEGNQSSERRLPGFGWLPNKVRNHFIAWVGEFVGYALFLGVTMSLYVN